MFRQGQSRRELVQPRRRQKHLALGRVQQAVGQAPLPLAVEGGDSDPRLCATMRVVVATSSTLA